TIATEVYELALVVWMMIAGGLPWPSGAGPAARRAISELPGAGALGAVLRRALSTVPERRPAAVAALLDGPAACEGRGAGGGARQTGAVTARARPPGLAERSWTPAPPTVGSVIGETYRLLELLGRGGAGTVFEAEHLRLPRRFAIKVLASDRDDVEARA